MVQDILKGTISRGKSRDNNIRFRDFDELLKRAKLHLQPGSDTDLRQAAYLIVDYYKCLLDVFGRKNRLSISESQNIKRKFEVAKQKYPRLKTFENLVEEVDDLRNDVAHTDYKPPRISDIQRLVSNADFFERALVEQVRRRQKGALRKNRIEEALDSLKDWVDELRALGSTANEVVEQYEDRISSYRILKRSLESRKLTTLATLLTLIEDDVLRAEDEYDRLNEQIRIMATEAMADSERQRQRQESAEDSRSVEDSTSAEDSDSY